MPAIRPALDGALTADAAAQRLFVICAANVTGLDGDHLEQSDTEPTHSRGRRGSP